MSNLQPLKWHDESDADVRHTAQSALHNLTIQNSEVGKKYEVKYESRRGVKYRSKPATGFATIEDAKEWCWDHHNEKMQPYVKPMPTWIDVNKRLPEEDGLYLALRKGFTFEMGNASDLVPQVSGWNGGRGCFDDDHGNMLFVAWMPIPEFSTMKNIHKGE